MDSQDENQTNGEIVITADDVLFECPCCGKSMVIDQSAIGMIVDCPQCSAQVIVPPRPADPSGENRRAQVNESLLRAVHRGDPLLLDNALAQGADINAAGPDGMTALMVAVESGYGDIVEILIVRGANLQARRRDGQTALMLAERAGQFHIVRMLWKARPNPIHRLFELRRRWR